MDSAELENKIEREVTSISKNFRDKLLQETGINLDMDEGEVKNYIHEVLTVTGINFNPSAVVTLQFDGNLVTTNPSTITPNSNGEFSATFRVPLSSSNSAPTVVATQGDISASATFTVTPVSTLPATSQSNVAEQHRHLLICLKR